MMEYIKLFWEDAPEGEPSVILYEVDTENERLALHSIDTVSYTHLRRWQRLDPPIYRGILPAHGTAELTGAAWHRAEGL